MTLPVEDDLTVFESHRALLVAHAYRLDRAQDMAQEAWLRWSGRSVQVESAKAYLVTLVTRLCLNELASARARREESRADRLPEPVNLEDAGIGHVDLLEQVSMAFLVTLQRLTLPGRAVLLLREVFEFEFTEIAALIQKSAPHAASCWSARARTSPPKSVFLRRPRTHTANS